MDDAVASPTITLTITPSAERITYDSVQLISTLENTVISEVKETEENSGVWEITVDIGMQTDPETGAETYVPNDAYMFHALAIDEFDNLQSQSLDENDELINSEEDGTKITVNVDNRRRPAPGVLAITVDNTDEMTNPDSGAPQGMITINGYTPKSDLRTDDNG